MKTYSSNKKKCIFHFNTEQTLLARKIEIENIQRIFVRALPQRFHKRDKSFFLCMYVHTIHLLYSEICSYIPHIPIYDTNFDVGATYYNTLVCMDNITRISTM